MQRIAYPFIPYINALIQRSAANPRISTIGNVRVTRGGSESISSAVTPKGGSGTDFGLSPNFTEWTEYVVRVWLHMQLGLKEYVRVFRENHVTG